MKLIHSGKVLKDTETISACGINPNDFLVVMVTKAKKTPAPAPAAAAPTPTEPADAKTPATAPPAETPAAPSRQDDFPAGAVETLTAMGFPEAEVRHCLRAAHGNPDIAVEFLTNGIPEGVAQVASAMGSSSPAASTSTPGGSSGGSAGPLQALRSHPQFNDLRRLVQSNPQMLSQVLTQIGQQQPELLREINENQSLFLQMMNEPVDSSSGGGSGRSSSSAPRGGGGGGTMPGGMGSPAQMAQMIQSMSPDEVEQMAAMMGLPPDQLRQMAQVIGSLPPEQLNQYMMQAMEADRGGAGGIMGDGILRLTADEMAAVDRLAEMGFDRAEAAQAFLACDKDEAMAANLLMDSMGEGGAFGFGDDSGNNDDGNNNDGNNDDDDEMYD